MAQLWEAGRPEDSHSALGCMAATGRIESKRVSDVTAADGMRDLTMSTTTGVDSGWLQQRQRAEHTECHEQCSAAASKCVCLQQEMKALTAAKIENFSTVEMPLRIAAASSASCISCCAIGVHCSKRNLRASVIARRNVQHGRLCYCIAVICV